MNAHDRSVDQAQKKNRGKVEDSRLSPRAALAVWIVGSLAGWAVIVALIWLLL
ncbi:MAG: hypothetical protein ACE5H8_05195 [Alphaproteobacteria bacterium]